MTEPRKTKKLPFNSADVILILAVLAIISGIVFRRPVESMIADRFSSVNVRYTLLVYAPDEQNEFLKSGEHIFNSDGENIGTIETVSAEKTTAGNSDKRIRLVLTVVSEGLSDSSGLYVGKEEPMFIAPGKTLDAHSSDYTSFTGIVKTAEKMQ